MKNEDEGNEEVQKGIFNNNLQNTHTWCYSQQNATGLKEAQSAASNQVAANFQNVTI